MLQELVTLDLQFHRRNPNTCLIPGPKSFRDSLHET